jgi:hypothetical protein
MNAKEQIINVFKNKNIELKASVQRLNLKYGWTNDSAELKMLSDAIKNNLSIITATESAIFELPSEEEIENKANLFKHEYYQGGFHDGCDFILTYKKPEPNGE